ncbi:MAG: hypothetical protein JO212_00395, partial [Acetobacteraceae bacterium]|nr:hypothetical protein [Acetobacteraceae bacterium]
MKGLGPDLSAIDMRASATGGAPARGKIVTAAEAVRLIREGDTVASTGFVGIG